MAQAQHAAGIERQQFALLAVLEHDAIRGRVLRDQVGGRGGECRDAALGEDRPFDQRQVAEHGAEHERRAAGDDLGRGALAALDGGLFVVGF
jgi:hypothetical protein